MEPIQGTGGLSFSCFLRVLSSIELQYKTNSNVLSFFPLLIPSPYIHVKIQCIVPVFLIQFPMIYLTKLTRVTTNTGNTQWIESTGDHADEVGNTPWHSTHCNKPSPFRPRMKLVVLKWQLSQLDCDKVCTAVFGVSGFKPNPASWYCFSHPSRGTGTRTHYSSPVTWEGEATVLHWSAKDLKYFENEQPGSKCCNNEAGKQRC